ncbi:MAG: stage II sporulation protein M [Clostridia bacterium]|nr:stage II sporulation protein M [Clostridia bacterium]
MKQYLRNYIEENFKVLSVIFFCLIIGLVVGIILYNMIDASVEEEILKSMRQTLELTKQENFTGINVIKNGMIANIVLVTVIYLVSLSLIAPYVMSILSISKGLAIGIYIPTLFSIFGPGKGLVALLLLVILPNLLYIPAYLYTSANSLKFNHEIIARESSKMSLVAKESIRVLIGFSIMFLSIVVEQLTTLGVISLYGGI